MWLLLLVEARVALAATDVAERRLRLYGRSAGPLDRDAGRALSYAHGCAFRRLARDGTDGRSVPGSLPHCAVVHRRKDRGRALPTVSGDADARHSVPFRRRRALFREGRGRAHPRARWWGCRALSPQRVPSARQRAWSEAH